MYSSAAALTETRSARSSLRKKMLSFPVSFLSSSIAFCDFSSERVAIYTLAPFESSTYERTLFINEMPQWGEGRLTRAVSLPIPPLPPVTMTVFPVWSGTSAAVQVGFGGKSWLMIPIWFSDMVQRMANNCGDNELLWGKGGTTKVAAI